MVPVYKSKEKIRKGSKVVTENIETLQCFPLQPFVRSFWEDNGCGTSKGKG